MSNPYRDLHTIAIITAILLLGLHDYYYCYQALAAWGYTLSFVDRIVISLYKSGLFHHAATTLLLSLASLTLSMIGNKGQPTGTWRSHTIGLSISLAIYLSAPVILTLSAPLSTLAALYLIVTSCGLLSSYYYIRQWYYRIAPQLPTDIFNDYNESFPQEERKLPAPYSLHFPTTYHFQNQERSSWINLVDIFRGTLIMGIPGSGKTRFLFRQIIQQSLSQGMALFVFDFKYDDLTKLTYNTLRQLQEAQTASHQATISHPSRAANTPPASAPSSIIRRLQFYQINFDDPNYSHRCNPIAPEGLQDITDAAEVARTFLLALNKDWIAKQGDFFVESAIGFFTANIWFLRVYEDGRYCTLAHLLELIQTEFPKLFSIIRSIPECETLIAPFASALGNHSMEQLQGQVDSTRIALSPLASPQLYYIFSANDFTLDINNPQSPKVVCIGSNPQKQLLYGVIISLYVSRMNKLVNKKGGVPCHLIYDEFASFRSLGMDTTLATARSNQVAVTLGIQDLAQLRTTYGRDLADVLFNLPGNIICGQVSGESANQVSAMMGKVLVEKTTRSTNSKDSSETKSKQLELALPASKIARFSSGEFAGITADSPRQPIQLKTFHARFQVDHAAIDKEEAQYQPLPKIRQIDKAAVTLNFLQIKSEVRYLVDTRLDEMMQDPELVRLIIVQNTGLNRKQTP